MIHRPRAVALDSESGSSATATKPSLEPVTRIGWGAEGCDLVPWVFRETP